jgi:hypothetical protein
MKTTITQRISIHPKDVALLTGYSEGYSRRLIRKIKLFYNKLPHQMLCIKEFADYMDWNEEEIRSRIS